MIWGDDLPLSEAAIDVVIVHRDRGAGLVTAHAGGPAVDLDDDLLADPEVIQRLRESLLRLDTAEDVPSTVVNALRAQPVPALFLQSPWLRAGRALVLEDGETRIAGVRIGYVAAVGLQVGEQADSTERPP
jgi:Cas3 C-terminal domain